MRAERCALALIAALACASPAAAQPPMSAIDWLSDSIMAPVPSAQTRPGNAAPPQGIVDEPISVTPLDPPQHAAAAGLFPAARAGLPRDFWGSTPAGDLALRLRSLRVDTLPVLQQMLLRILQAEFAPPAIAADDPPDALLLARVDKLLDFGALEQAMLLIEAAGEKTPELSRRWFDIALLLGDEDRACDLLRDRADLSPSYPARIFCMARGGDWQMAALMLRNAETLGVLSVAEADLLARFLDPELAEDMPVGPVPPMTPLNWRLLEATGAQVPTYGVPLAFAHADLRGTAGWRAQLEAAERLARSGALEPNRLLGLYTPRRAAASGGVWDRVRAIRHLDAMLERGDPAQVELALRNARDAMAGAELEHLLTVFVDGRTERVPPGSDAAALVFELALLGPDYERHALDIEPADARERFLVQLARGLDLSAHVPPGQRMAAAIAEGFNEPAELPPDVRERLSSGHGADELLRAIDRLGEGTAGNFRAVSESLALLRHSGFEDLARRAGLQLMILHRGEQRQDQAQGTGPGR